MATGAGVEMEGVVTAYRYSEADVERLHPEPESRRARDPFRKDRARILHSQGFRKLGDITQVNPPGLNDYSRTRLTHSLEVAQIAGELVGMFGGSADLGELAGLGHDLGHPPFGHTGESVLNDLAIKAGLEGFEGNAQTFRIVTRLEPKTLPDGGGLNLTRASLDALLKYPWRKSGEHPDKYGVYEDDQPVYDWVKRGAPQPDAKSWEAQLMDWADDVAYSTHDVEDAIVTGCFQPALIGEPSEQRRLAETAQRVYAPDSRFGDLLAAVEWIANHPHYPEYHTNTASLRSQAAVKQFTSDLVGVLVNDAVGFVATGAPGCVGRYPEANGQPLFAPPEDLRNVVAVLKSVAYLSMMSTDVAKARRAEQQRVLRGLHGMVSARPEVMVPAYFRQWLNADDGSSRGKVEQEQSRLVIDFLASLSDVSAVKLWQSRGANG